MLDEHWASNRSVLGKWNDISADEYTLSAVAEFDTEDADANKIAGKVTRGYIKGASVGLLYDPKDMVVMPDGTYELAKSELIEASICAIPSNAGALRLYHNINEPPLTEEAVRLSFPAPEIKLNFKKDRDMQKIVLSVASLIALGLDKQIGNPSDGVDAALLEQSIQGIKAKLDEQEQKLNAANLAVKTLQDAALAQKKLAAKKIVEDAISAGKINATAKEEWLQLATDNEALAKTTLDAIPAKQSLAGMVSNPGATGAVSDMDAFQKLSAMEQLRFKSENPEAYAKLVSSL